MIADLLSLYSLIKLVYAIFKSPIRRLSYSNSHIPRARALISALTLFRDTKELLTFPSDQIFPNFGTINYCGPSILD